MSVWRDDLGRWRWTVAAGDLDARGGAPTRQIARERAGAIERLAEEWKRGEPRECDPRLPQQDRCDGGVRRPR